MRGDARTKYRRDEQETIDFLSSGGLSISRDIILEYMENHCRSVDICTLCGGRLDTFQGDFTHKRNHCEKDTRMVIKPYYWVDESDIDGLESFYLTKCEYCGDRGESCRLFQFEQILCKKCNQRQTAKMKKWRQLRSLLHEEMILVQSEVYNMVLKEQIKRQLK